MPSVASLSKGANAAICSRCRDIVPSPIRNSRNRRYWKREAMQNSAPLPASPIPICGIGASAGGIEALENFFDSIPNDLGLAYVVVLHLAPDHKSELPAILARWTSMPVQQVADS